ncbi:YfcE family phosphodiesterase [Colidextribacter sp. OB.20]|uniref:metallophosphoesterase family protein n=1 Tax=Colidextribacter sp. OB.20 TaxID=2304568 RepID=UPI00136FF77A|nr:YfcE family phosphodiesterase [Colidextribacter sp. OB.20]NBI11715.1 YfcE family phosphodiesterase [Colidextribacter sp. OB.20]
MKLLVFSDSHRSLSGMYAAIDRCQPQQVIHLGDMMYDAEEVAEHYPRLPFCMVPGNCDGWGLAVPVKKNITLGGKSILLSHGHRWNVKSGYDAAIADARAVGADILLFGHTHIPLLEQLEDGLWMMNPGPARSSFGLIEIENGEISCSLLQTK